MQNQSWTVGGALSELVDNGFGPGRGNANRVTITHNPSKRTITVLDDGQGMEAIGRLFQLGNTIGRTPGDIGHYGSGGTMALLWLASKVTVWTLRDGLVSYDTVDWPKQIKKREFPRVSNTWEPAAVNNTPTELLNVRHGTLIELHLADERSFYASNAQRDLARNYMPATRLGKELIWTTLGRGGGTQILADPMVMLPDDPSKTVDLDLTLPVGGELLSLTGTVGLVKDLPHSRSRVAIGYGPRVILWTRDCYESADKTERFVGTGVTGWLDLDDGWQPYLSTTKDRINDQPVWDLLMEYVFMRIRPLLAQVEQDELFLELEDLAIDLQEALNGNYEVTVDRKRKPMPDDIEFGPPEPPDDDEEEPEAEEPKDQEEGEAKQKKAPARSRILISPQSDEQMEGTLCKAELYQNDSEILVTVNKDHPVVRETLKAKPVNRMALNMMTTREIAAEIVKRAIVLKRVFPAHILETIDSRPDDAQAQYVARLLMDRVRRVEGTAA